MIENYLAIRRNEVLTHATTGWTLKTLCQMKEGSQERPHIVWFYLYEISIIDNVIEIEIRLIIA